MRIAPYRRKPHFYETDQMAIIHHANYIHWFEEARVDLMEQIGYGYERATGAGIDFAVLGISCDYKTMARFGDTIDIQCTIDDFSATRMTISYEVRDAASGELRATGKSRHCFFSNGLKRPVSMKKTLPELFELFSSLCGETAEPA